VKKVVGYVLLGLIVVVGIILAVAAFQPKEFKIERSVTTTGSAEAVYNLMSDFKRLSEWSPWVQADPNSVLSYGEITQGQGAWYSWNSKQMGAGKQTIVNAVPNQRVDSDLEFLEPWPSVAKAYYAIEDDGTQRKVFWGMTGSNDSILQRAGAMMFDMDGMISREFDKGLNNVKAVVEGRQ
jgi:hypothetical protein